MMHAKYNLWADLAKYTKKNFTRDFYEKLMSVKCELYAPTIKISWKKVRNVVNLS